MNVPYRCPACKRTFDLGQNFFNHIPTCDMKKICDYYFFTMEFANGIIKAIEKRIKDLEAAYKDNPLNGRLGIEILNEQAQVIIGIFKGHWSDKDDSKQELQQYDNQDNDND